MLTHRNVIESSRMSAEFDRLDESVEGLAYLPMAWVGDFVFSVGQSYVCGFCVSCPESRETMMTDLREIGPTFFFAPPRIFEHIQTSVMVAMEDSSKLKRKMFHQFIQHARRVGPDILDGKPIGLRDRFWYAVGDVLVYGPLRKRAWNVPRSRRLYGRGGDRSGDFQFLPLLGNQFSSNSMGRRRQRCLLPHSRTERFVTTRSEFPTPASRFASTRMAKVLYRSPGVFREYYRDPESTAKTRTEDGWVHSGDAGFLEEGTGHLRILDRVKDVGRLADGTVFSPKFIENKLKFYPEIQEAVVIGDGCKEVVAMLNLDLAAVGSWAERNDVVYASYQELATHPQIYEIMRRNVEAVNRSLAEDPNLAPCQIRRFLILHKELDADDGELTPDPQGAQENRERALWRHYRCAPTTDRVPSTRKRR